jgi:hypothetical protein
MKNTVVFSILLLIGLLHTKALPVDDDLTRRLADPAQANATASSPGAILPSVKALADQLPCTVDFFEVAGCHAFLIRPKGTTNSSSTPWVWYAPVIGYPSPSHAWMLRQWLAKGIGMAGVDVGESYGSPRGRAVFTELWKTLTQRSHMSERPCLLPSSRGGLMLYNWAAENPTRIACIAGIYPVGDLRSYPGLKNASPAYGLSPAELQARLAEHNPIDRLAPLARAGVPILHVHGDLDTQVPLERNSAELARRYRALGGNMRLIVIPGKGHQVCPEFFQCQEFVDFVIAHSRPDKKAGSQQRAGLLVTCPFFLLGAKLGGLLLQRSVDVFGHRGDRPPMFTR